MAGAGRGEWANGATVTTHTPPTLAEAAAVIESLLYVSQSIDTYQSTASDRADILDARAFLARIDAYDEQAEAVARLYEDVGLERIEDAWFNAGVTEQS